MELNGTDPAADPPDPYARLADNRGGAGVVAPGEGVRTSRPGTGGTRRRKRRNSQPRHGRAYRLARALLAVALVVSVLTGIAALRLSRGPVSLAFLQPAIERAVTAELGRHVFKVRDVQLGLGANGLEIELADIRINDADGTALVQAPRAVAGISSRAALEGQFGLSRVDLVNPRLQVFYTEDGTLSIKFAQSPEVPQPDGAGAGPPAAIVQASGPDKAGGDKAGADTAGAVSFVSTLTEISAKARRRDSATAYLREIGLRQATVIVDNGRRKTIWRVPEIQIDLQHKTSSSLVGGRAIVDGLTGPWSLDFRTIEAVAAQQVVVLATVHDLNPRGLSRQIPALANFERFDVPLDGEARIELSTQGIVSAATFAFTARQGIIQGVGQVEAGAIKGAYDAQAARVQFSNVSLSVDRNRLDLTGAAARSATPASTGLPLWNFEFASTAGTLAPASPGSGDVPIDQFRMRGQFVPEAGQLLLQDIALNAGGAAVTAKASVSDLATDASRSADLEATIAPMPIERVIALWPSAIAPAARAWLATHVSKGQFNGGTIKLASSGDNRVSMAMDLTATELMTMQGMPPLIVPRGRVRVEGGDVEITIPDASIGGGRQAIGLKGVRITAIDPGDGTPPVADVQFRLLGPVAAALDLADREPFRLLRSRGIVLHTPEGRIDGQIKMTLPISDALQVGDIKTEAHLRLTDGHLRQVVAGHDLTGARITVDVTASAIDARGDFLLKGIPIKFAGQHFLNSAPDRQSPFRVTLKLDDADRAQLGLDINDLVSGEVPVEVLVGPDAQGEMQAHVTADLTSAELTLDSVAFRKPPGLAAQVQFDPVRIANGRTELRNFKIAGRSIAAEGMITLGADNKAKELSFPELSLNTVSRLELQSHLGPDNIWELRAKGSTFDGRDLFRELFNVQNTSKPVPKTKPGLNLTADIDTVVGFSDSSLKRVHVVMQKRSDSGFEKTTALDITASHDAGKTFKAHIGSIGNGQSKLVASSDDAGQTFKLVGFYPNATGGQMHLEVDLDGRGAIERNGVLKADRFAVFGDPVVSEVFQNSDGGTGTHARKNVIRERIDFDWMVLPFSVGSNQFVMNDAEIRGPLVGARMRGKVDFKSQRMQVGGTYIPLSGLNSALGGLPILGQLLAGPKGEGMFGFTFVIQGPMAAPEVLVNPFSGFVPGILRETQQMAPESFKITPRSDTAPPAPIPKNAARASSASPATTGRAPGAATPPGQPPGVLSDWSSDGKPEPKARAKSAGEP